MSCTCIGSGPLSVSGDDLSGEGEEGRTSNGEGVMKNDGEDFATSSEEVKCLGKCSHSDSDSDFVCFKGRESLSLSSSICNGVFNFAFVIKSDFFSSCMFFP